MQRRRSLAHPRGFPDLASEALVSPTRPEVAVTGPTSENSAWPCKDRFRKQRRYCVGPSDTPALRGKARFRITLRCYTCYPYRVWESCDAPSLATSRTVRMKFSTSIESFPSSQASPSQLVTPGASR
jgi:hypothetical protein